MDKNLLALDRVREQQFHDLNAQLEKERLVALRQYSIERLNSQIRISDDVNEVAKRLHSHKHKTLWQRIFGHKWTP